jgi:hypothetical protein
MEYRLSLLTVIALGLPLAGVAGGCDDSERAGGDTDTDADTDGDTDGDTDADADADTDADSDVTQDCSECTGIGEDVDAMACALDICAEGLVVSAAYASPTGSTTAGTHAAVAHFGSPGNDLAPHRNGSYVLMATGTAAGTGHSVDMGGAEGFDPFSKDDCGIYDVMEWSLKLEAPVWAGGFAFDFVFLSEEYDEYIGLISNDKFYAIIEAPSTSGGAPTVINFAECRDPDAYCDHLCEEGELGCEEGEPYCFIAINSARSECCWHDGCPDGTAQTDISGTGFECAAGQLTDADTHGSSTGWLSTSWPVDAGETFKLTFHIHDTGDPIFDSEVILDNFRFLPGEVVPET